MAGKIAQGKGAREKLIAAVGHPIRMRAMTILNEQIASPVAIAQVINRESNLSLEPGHVSYHIRELVKADLAELVDTKQVRGATEHFYRGTHRPLLYGPEWEQMGLEERQRWSEGAWSILVHEATRALEAGTFDSRLDRYFTQLPMNLDEEGWRAMSEMQDEMLQRAFTIQNSSDARRQVSRAPATRAIAAMLMFEPARPTEETG